MKRTGRPEHMKRLVYPSNPIRRKLFMLIANKTGTMVDEIGAIIENMDVPLEEVVNNLELFEATFSKALDILMVTKHESDLNPLKLYVASLCPTIDESKLFDLFGPYGNVESATVIRGKRGESKCFGFVTFSRPYEAEVAVKEMHGKIINGIALYVKVAYKRNYNTSGGT